MENDGWQEHQHEALAHNHRHYHVTHNWNERVGGFEHLNALHDHEHDHASLSHAHYPHQNFDEEHQGEAHVHDHEHAVRSSTRKPASTRKTAKTSGGDGERATASSSRRTRASKS